MSSDAANEYDEDDTQSNIINCTFCKQRFRNPRTLPCQHTFCRKCLRSYLDDLDGSEPVCTICGAVFSGSDKAIEGSKKDFLIQRLLECDSDQLENQSCSLCSSDATEKCFHCNHCLCERDAEHHRKIPSMGNHTLVSLQKYQRMSALERLSLYPTKCSVHEDYIVEYFCSTCDEPVCIKCTLDDHDRTDHNLHSINEVIETDKKELSEEQSFVSTQYDKLTKAEKKVLETRDQLVEAKVEALKTIEMRSDDLRKQIDELQNELADEITEKYNSKVDVLDKQLDDMDRRMNELDTASSYIDALLQCNNSDVFLSASKKWYEQFKEKKPHYKDVELEPTENSYLRVEVDEKPIDEVINSAMICTVFCTSAAACHSQLNGCPEEAEIGSEVKFTIIIKDKEDSKVALRGTSPNVEVMSPNDHKTTLKGETSSESKFKYEWCPSSLGKHTLAAQVFDIEVKGSPMIINVVPKNSKDQQQQKNNSARSQKKPASGAKSSKSKQPETRKSSWKK